jgi:hypothetical protein
VGEPFEHPMRAVPDDLVIVDQQDVHGSSFAQRLSPQEG